MAQLLRKDADLSCRYRKTFGAPPSPENDETVLVNAYYDSWSPIPSLAPGARQLLGLQGLLQTAEHLASSRNRAHFRRKVVLFLSAGRGQAASGSRHLLSALGTESEPEKILEARARRAGA